MRTAIYGAGSLGTILGAYINKAGEPIELINRNKAHVEALQNSGAKVVGTVDFTQKVTAYTPAEMSGTYDIIFLMTKQQHNKEVVTMLKDFLAPDGVLVTFQNGLPEIQIAEILGVEAEDVVEKVAFVACNGTCEVVSKKYEYQGHKSCRTANMAYSGDRICNFACLGYGDCMTVCPQGAISIKNGVARVSPRKCIGCGICVRKCPNGIIHLVNDPSRVVVECSNHDKGAVTRKLCTNGCIGCMKCQKVCPTGAVKVENNLATIDYSLCTGCGACDDVCPVHCIHEDNFICGAH